jgi:hypothetical protein
MTETKRFKSGAGSAAVRMRFTVFLLSGPHGQSPHRGAYDPFDVGGRLPERFPAFFLG